MQPNWIEVVCPGAVLHQLEVGLAGFPETLCANEGRYDGGDGLPELRERIIVDGADQKIGQRFIRHEPVQVAHEDDTHGIFGDHAHVGGVAHVAPGMAHQLLVIPGIYEKAKTIRAIAVQLILGGEHRRQAPRRQDSLTAPEDHQLPGKHIFHVGVQRRTPGVTAVVRVEVADLEMTAVSQYVRAGGEVGRDVFHSKGAVAHFARIEQMRFHIGLEGGPANCGDHVRQDVVRHIAVCEFCPGIGEQRTMRHTVPDIPFQRTVIVLGSIPTIIRYIRETGGMRQHLPYGDLGIPWIGHCEIGYIPDQRRVQGYLSLFHQLQYGHGDKEGCPIF